MNSDAPLLPGLARPEPDPAKSSAGRAPSIRRVRVAIPVPVDSLFTYAVPRPFDESALPGCRALVPFSGRRLTGIIVEADHGPATDLGRLQELDRVLDETPILSASMMDILRKAAIEFLCPIGIALSTALPPASAPRPKVSYRLSSRGQRAVEAGALPGPLQELAALLVDRPRALRTLVSRVSDAADRLRELEADDLVTRQLEVSGMSLEPVRERRARVAEGVDVEAVCAAELVRAPRQAEVLRAIASAGELATASLGSSGAGALRPLLRRGFAEIVLRETTPSRRRPAPREAPPQLTEDQVAVLDPLYRCVRERRHQRFLLHGVTGSGKTEIYLRAIASALEQGRQALVLVPEISLTHQIVARLQSRFGDALAVLHSGLTASERLREWIRLQRAEVPIAVGARSALFAPLGDLGIIVIDEEHDGAYKNEEGFRYHARRIAELLAEEAGCPLLMGSATPSLELRHAAEQGEITRLRLPRRIGGRPLPAVQLVDLAREKARAPRGRKLILTGPLRRAMSATLQEGGQTILFLNRRGFSTRIFCFECGHAEHCKECDVALVYHAAEHQLRCHYCDATHTPPEFCTGCGAPDTALLGVGTERLEEEVRSFLPKSRIGRLDRDTARRRGHMEATLASLGRGELDILIGTQMVAKGHDFPGVQLVGVIAADLGLHLPDFRAAERTFQLLTQVAGRAGRAGAPGRVVVQTFVPDHYAIAPATQHDYESFYKTEIEHRAQLGYPPFGHLAHIVVSATDEVEARGAAERVRIAITSHVPRPELEVLGPAPAPLARLRGRHRIQILLKCRDRETLMEGARAAASALGARNAGSQLTVDVAPVHML